MNKTRRIVALAGLSGAGKTTLIKNVIEYREYAHLSASDLIKEYRKSQGSSSTSEQLRAGDIQDNQTQFVKAFKAHSEEIYGHIILDCHTLIDTPSGLQYVPVETFATIGITNIVFLSVEPGELIARREADTTRTRPQRSAIDLQEQQQTARLIAIEISKKLNIPFNELGDDPQKELGIILDTPDYVSDKNV